MAQLKSLLVNGTSRFLNTIYATDLNVSGTTSFASLDVSGNIVANGTLNIGSSTAANAIIYLNGKKAIAGTDGWLRINEENKFASGVYFGTNLVRTDGSIQVGSSGSKINMGTAYARFNVPIYMNNSGNTYKWTTDGNIVVNNVNATTATLGATTITNGKATTLDVSTLNVTHQNIEHVANLGGTFLVTPTVKCISSGSNPTLTSFSVATTSASRENSENVNVTYNYKLTIADTAFTTATIGTITWTQYSEVKVSGTIDGIVLGTCNGYIESIETGNTHRVVINIKYDGTGSLSTPSDITTVDGLTIMLTNIWVNGTEYDPIGIWMKSADSDGRSHISLYGGTTTDPVVRIGNLAGLPKVNGKSPVGWGIYTNHGYFDGVIVSNEGKIGGWTLGSNVIYSGTHNTWSHASNGLFLGTTRIAGGSGGTWYLDQNGTGKIGRWAFTSGGELSTTVSSNTAGMGNGTYAFWAGAASSNAANAPFRVKYDGTLNATSATISGAITATSLTLSQGVTIGQDKIDGLTDDLNDAAKTATNYLTFEPAHGLMIANQSDAIKTITTEDGKNVLIDNDSVDIRNGQTVMASFGEHVIIGESDNSKLTLTPVEMVFKKPDNTEVFKVTTGEEYYAQTEYEQVSRPTGTVSHIAIDDNIVNIGIVVDGTALSNENWYQQGNTIYFTPPIEGASTITIHGDEQETQIVALDSPSVTVGQADKAHSVIDTDGQRFYAKDGITLLANIGYGEGASTSSTAVVAPYYTIGVRTTNSNIGNYSIATGYSTTASGYASHSEGQHSKASGHYSHAEGYLTTASKDNSHAEGRQTVASGLESHAEGWLVTASGHESHAEGYRSVANGKYSHAQNCNTIATEEAQTVIGRYNKATISGSGTEADPYVYSDVGDYAFIIGNGGAITRSNALTVDWKGNILSGNIHKVPCVLRWTFENQTAAASTRGSLQNLSVSGLPSSATVLGVVVTSTPNRHWIWASAYANSNNTIGINYVNEYNGAISGSFSVLIFYTL